MGQLTKQEKADLKANKKACKNCAKTYMAAQKMYSEYRNIFKKLLGYCPCCERYFRYNIKTHRRNTAYCEESKNWLTACKECIEEDRYYFAELWNDYYSGIL